MAVRHEAQEGQADARPQAPRLPLVSRFTPHGSWQRAENKAEAWTSFAAVERSMSDRLLVRAAHRLESFHVRIRR